MLTSPEIDPVALAIGPIELLGRTLGPIQVHWYGLMYLFGFIGGWSVAYYRAGASHTPVNRKQIEDLVFYCALGVVLGGRLGYILFYNFSAFLDQPSILFRVWEGGMSFHGGLLGVAYAVYLYSKKVSQPFLAVMDFVAPLVTIGLGLGRIGNFIGQELWGRATDASWGMVFPRDPEALARHPSQLYQAFLEGVVLFVILMWFSAKPRPRASVSALFLIIYGIFRFMVEFVREPDAHIGFDLLGWMTRGQLLSLPMVIIGCAIFYWAYQHDGSVTHKNAKQHKK